jgi:tetratricopeptide (TPR) repeat protein
MFAFCFSSPADPGSSSRIVLITLFAICACVIPQGLCAVAPAPCAKPPALAARLRTHPDAQAWIDLGNFYGDQKQFVCAQQAFRSGLRLDPKSAQLNYLLGLSLYGSGDLEHALPPLQRSIQTNNGILKPHLLLASIDATLGQPGEAETEWRAALAIDSSSDMAIHGLAESLLMQKNYPAVIGFLRSVKLDVPLAIDLAVAYNADGIPDDAITTITDALKTWPTSVRLSAALVTLDVKAKLYDAAERIAAACYQSHPDDVDAQISYMKTLVLNGDWVPARPVGKQMLTEAPHRFETLYFNGVLERQGGDFAAARDHLTEAEGLDPNLANLHYNLGVALSRLNNPVRAIEELRKAVALGDTQPETHFELAKVLRTQGQTDDAGKEMVLYQNLIQHEAQVSIAGSKTAEADQAVEKGDLQLAIQRYREAVAATPDNALISWKLSLALDKANDPDGEHQALEQVIAIDPNFALAQNQLGYLDSRKGDLAGAEQHFHQALQAAPGFTQAWISLAATLGMESKFPEARDALASALRLDPQNTQARELSQELTAAQNQPHH